ncbi:X-ray radiation resistance-associated protein 1 [Notolabrus celidotus]|uniref:X-ray radiation resistance-associated protein 1 n=1 Tax=Notolabrus celidotus TaxID=1203425 RepID=UPI0014905D7A|nr:X-ray radiation resistance-associated protein 1 [Notolabrus celidotus]
MTAESHELLLDGQNHLTKCFPARTFQHRGQEGAGHWLVAYSKAEEQRYRTLQRRIKETYRKCHNTDPVHNTLDAPFLLQSHCVDKPSTLCSVDISEKKLNSVNPAELKDFINVVYIDASINALSLDSFSSFVSLKELNLSLNGLCSMTFDAADFPHLEVLDLSYNNLSADAVVSIGWLPRLKGLHLTGNKLHHLPPNLGSSISGPATEEDTQFRTLEVLMLDENKLSSAVFTCLKNLKRLKYLNLQDNRITKIPYLQPTGFLKPSAEEEVEEEVLANTESYPNTEEHHKKISQVVQKDEPCRDSSLPLPALQYLNLSDNKIAEEDALMAAALFPSLREIDICSNPLTTRRSGDPPLLTYYLQERLGITIKRKKTQKDVKLPMKVSTDPKWKVEERISKVSKLLREALCPASTQVEKNETAGKKTPESNQENTEHFFVTQATDFPQFECADVKDTAETKEKNRAVNIPEEFLCYETLIDAKANPGEVEPIGIQTAVRMLEHTLKNLNVYRDSKPKLDSVQTPYRERERRVKKLPPLKLIKQPSEKVDEIIKEIKQSSSIREVSLSRAIRSSSVTKQDRKEAQSLLRDMKTKYKMVHQKTMEQVTDTNHNKAEPPPVNMNPYSSA